MFTPYRRGYPLPLIRQTRTATGATYIGWSHECPEMLTNEWSRVTSLTATGMADRPKCRVRVQVPRSPYLCGVTGRETWTQSPTPPSANSPTSSWR